MNIDWSFPRQVLVTLFVICGAAVYPLLVFGSGDVIAAAAAGALLATTNVLLGYAAIEYSVNKSATAFLKYVLGGMGIRLMLIGGILMLLIKALHIHEEALIISLGIFYVVFQTLEVLFIHKRITLRHQN